MLPNRQGCRDKRKRKSNIGNDTRFNIHGHNRCDYCMAGVEQMVSQQTAAREGMNTFHNIKTYLPQQLQMW